MIARNEKVKVQRKRARKRREPAAVLLEKKKRAWMQKLMAQSLYKIVELKGPINITAEQLDSTPEDWMDKIKIEVRPEGFTFKLKKEGVIDLPPERKIIV